MTPVICRSGVSDCGRARRAGLSPATATLAIAARARAEWRGRGAADWASGAGRLFLGGPADAPGSGATTTGAR